VWHGDHRPVRYKIGVPDPAASHAQAWHADHRPDRYKIRVPDPAASHAQAWHGDHRPAVCGRPITATCAAYPGAAFDQPRSQQCVTLSTGTYHEMVTQVSRVAALSGPRP